MKDIQFEYAINFNKNEQKFNLVRERLNECVMYFTKNTPFQLLMTDFMMDIIDISCAIEKGERGDYIYNKAIELCGQADLLKKEYEKSGVGERLSGIARVITADKKK